MQLQKIFVVLGPPGSGKGTQSELLAKTLNFPRIVIGDLRRAFIKESSPEAIEDKARYDQGIPGPDELISKLLRNAINNLQDTEGFVLDTFPLSMGQAKILDEIIGEYKVSHLGVLFLNVDKDKVVKRIMGRAQSRSDDKPEIAAARYDEYEKRNAPIKEFYRQKGCLIEINGDQTIEQVHAEIMGKLKSQRQIFL